MGMSTPIDWSDIALRLTLSLVVSVLLGYDRGEHGKAAGLRTTLLVCLAAAVAMIRVNLLLPTAGRPQNSFVMNDLMRLPLGILTGVGFIGGGAILRRDNMVVGITTAATLWLATVIGLCLGGGQIGLGLAAAGLGLSALWALRWVEQRLPREYPAKLSVQIDPAGPQDEELRAVLRSGGFSVLGARLVLIDAVYRELNYDLRRTRRGFEAGMPAVLRELAARPGVRRLQWDEPH